MLMKTEPAGGVSSGVTSQRRRPRRGSLKRRLIAWFLVVALLPLTVVSAVSYFSAKESLRAAAGELLAASVKEKAAFIGSWFYYRLVDLESQATSNTNARFLSDLRNAFEKSDTDLGDFVKSYRWNVIANEQGEDLTTFGKLYQYDNVFLIDAEGNVLFTIAEQSDLGTNLFRGPLAKTRFAASCRKVLDTGQPGFSDLESYAPANHAIAAFLASVIVDENGEKIGLLAFQLPYERIENAMRVAAGQGTGIQTYLIGHSPEQAGVTLWTRLNSDSSAERQNPSPGSAADFLTQRVDTEQTRLWIRQHEEDGVESISDAEQAFIYVGLNGDRVLGMQSTVSIADVDWGVIAEVPEHMAFAAANSLRTLVLGLVLTTALLVLIIATTYARRVVRPIVQLSSAAKLVTQGDLSQRIASETEDEIGELAHSFNGMLSGCVRLQDSRRAMTGSRPGRPNSATKCEANKRSPNSAATSLRTWPSTWGLRSAPYTFPARTSVSNWWPATRFGHERISPTSSASEKALWAKRRSKRKTSS